MAEESNGLQSRINKLGAKNAELQKSLSDAEAANAKLRTELKAGEALRGELAEAQAKLATANQRSSNTEALISAGVTDRSARDFLMFQFGASDSTDFQPWLDEQRANASGFVKQIFGGAATTSAPQPSAPQPSAPQPQLQAGAVNTENGSINSVNGGSINSAADWLNANNSWADLQKQIANGRRRG